MMEDTISRSKTIILLTFLVIVWGVCWPVFKVALYYTPPLLFGGMRNLVGGVSLAVLLLPRWRQIRWRQTWYIYGVAALFNSVLYYGAQSFGLGYLPAGLFCVIVYLQPVLVGLMAWMWLGESMTLMKIVGLILGFLGVAAVSSGGLSGYISFTGVVLAIICSVGWASGTVWVKKTSGLVDAMWLVVMQSLIGGAIMTIAGLWLEDYFAIVWTPGYWFGLLYGGLLAIAASWVIYYKLVHYGEASKVAAYTFLVPLISVATGTFFLQEPFTFYLLVGLVLIVTSIYLVNRPTGVGGKKTSIPV